MISENTAKYVGGVYMPMKLDEAINPRPRKVYEPGSVAERVKAKLR